MTEQIKVNIQTAITVIGFILTVGITYSAINGRVMAQERINTAQELKITVAAQERRSMMLQSARYETRQSDILKGLARVESELKNLERAD